MKIIITKRQLVERKLLGALTYLYKVPEDFYDVFGLDKELELTEEDAIEIGLIKLLDVKQ